MTDSEVSLRVEMGQEFEVEFPDASALATTCVINLFILNEQMDAFGDALVRRYGLPSRAAFNVLTILDGAREALPPSTIAARMIVTRATMTGILHSLERRGLVERQQHPEDGRMTLVAITPAAQAIVARLLPELHRAEKAWLNCLTEAEQRTLLSMVARLQANAPG